MRPLAVALTLLLPALLLSDAAQFKPAFGLQEGVDKQSPEEIEAARRSVAGDFAGAADPSALSAAQRAVILAKYSSLDPQGEVPRDLLDAAVLYFDSNRSRFANQNFLTVVDYKPRSDRYRLFIVKLKDGSVERYHTTHGAGSVVEDPAFAKIFGNEPGSFKSSLGYVRTAEVYSGQFGRSIRLDGLSETNSNLRERAIVVHGFDGAHESDVVQELSEGCLALDWSVKDHVIDEIKEGGLIYAGVSAGSSSR